MEKKKVIILFIAVIGIKLAKLVLYITLSKNINSFCQICYSSIYREITDWKQQQVTSWHQLVSAVRNVSASTTTGCKFT